MTNSEKFLSRDQIIGNWKAKRFIVDKLNEKTFSFLGKMVISSKQRSSEKKYHKLKPDFELYDIEEDGILKSRAKEYKFFQKYHLQIYDKKCEILFKNKDPFFTIKRVTETQQINYLCHLDRYDGRISFINKFSFLICLNVSGLNKKYCMRALYKRIKPATVSLP